MSSEQNAPEVYEYQGQSGSHAQDNETHFSGQNAPPGMGQSKSSRRRRRKRKNKGGGAGADAQSQDGPSVQGNTPQGEHAGPVPSMQASSQPQHQGGGQQQHGGGGKRWKKKFRDRDRPRGQQDNVGNVAAGGGNNGGGYRDRDSHQPGNTVYGKRNKGGGGKQQRGPRGFVGPMDHSYRATTGNFADTPPSTIETHQNGYRSGRGFTPDSGPIDYSQGRAVPIPENAPTRIAFFIEDLFLIAKIQETARKLGVKVAFIKNDKDAIAQLTGSVEEERPGLIVFDLNNANAKPLTLIPKLKTKFKRSTSIIGFLSHIQGDLKAKAMDAGCDTVMPRAAFSQNLPNLLRRYGMEEEEEPNFNQ
jgi:hypothetical protein